MLLRQAVYKDTSDGNRGAQNSKPGDLSLEDNQAGNHDKDSLHGVAHGQGCWVHGPQREVHDLQG